MISAALDELFRNPPRTFSPTPLWWWSGGRVTRERIRWQMRRFAEGGVYNLVVINLAPAGPIFGARPDDPPWFSEEWWERFTDTCEAARELDMKVWFYDQIGFSGANVQGAVTRNHPEAAGRALRFGRYVANRCRIALPRGHDLLAVYDENGDLVASSDDDLAGVPDGSMSRSSRRCLRRTTTSTRTPSGY